MDTKNESTGIEKFTSTLPALKGWKDKCLQVVSDNPFIEIVDAATSKQARANRTAYVTSGAELKNQRTLVNKKIKEFRDGVSDETDGLIQIMIPHKERQQTEIDRWDEIKAEQKRKKEEAEENRIKVIKGRITETEDECNVIIAEITVKDSAHQFVDLEIIIAAGKLTGDENFDFMEFEVLEEDMERRMLEDFKTALDVLVAAEKTAQEDLEKEQKAKIDSIYRECTEWIFADDLTAAELEQGVKDVLTFDYDFGIHLDLFNVTEENIMKQVSAKQEQINKAKEMQDREDRMKVLESLAEYREGVFEGIESITLDNEIANTKVVRLLIDKPSLKTELIPAEWKTFTELADKKLIARKKVLDKLQEDENKKAAIVLENLEKRTKERRAELRVIGLKPSEDESSFMGLGTKVLCDYIETTVPEVWVSMLENLNVDISEFKKTDQAAKRDAKKVSADKIVLSGFMSNIEIDFSALDKLKSEKGKALRGQIAMQFKQWGQTALVDIDALK